MPTRIRLTDKAISKLPQDPMQKDQFAWDTSLAGFGLKLSAGGGRSFVFQYRLHGKTRRLTIGSVGKISASTARDRAEAARTAVRGGRDPAEEKAQERQAQTLSEHAAEWLVLLELRVKRDELSKRTLDEYESKMRVHMLPAFGSKKPAEVSANAIRAWRDKALVKGAEAARPVGMEGVKGTLRVFSAFLSYLVERGIIVSNPAKGLGQFATKERERYLTNEEAARLGEVLDKWRERAPVWVAVLGIAAFSGMRKGEVLKLRWSDVHDEEGVILLDKHKTHRKTGGKRIPLTEPLREILARAAQWRRPGCPFVFPAQSDRNIAVQRGGKHPSAVDLRNHASEGGLKRAWTAMRKEAGLLGDDSLRFHDLRHAWGSTAASSGLSLPIIGKNMGHSSPATTARYAKVALSAAAQAAGAVARLVQERLATKPMERGSVVKLPHRKKGA